MAANGVILPPTFFRARSAGRSPDLRRRAVRERRSEASALRSRGLCAALPGVRGRGGAEDHEPRHVRLSDRARDGRDAEAGRLRPAADRERPCRSSASTRVNLGREKSVVLVIDRSQSMIGPGDRRTRPRRPAQFVGSKPGRDRIAVVAVGTQGGAADRLLRRRPPRRTPPCARSRVDKVRGTALYDGILVSTQALAADLNPTRVLILLTDGQEVSSDASLEQAIASAREAHVAVYPIGIESPSFRPGAAAATGREDRRPLRRRQRDEGPARRSTPPSPRSSAAPGS